MNPTNVGAIFRSAAALHMDAVLLTGGCSDPLYRRAARVSMGTVFQIPWTYFDKKTVWPSQGMAQLQNIGFKTVAMALRNDSVEIDDPELKRQEKLAIILGTEGEGLLAETMEACDYTVKIPMSHGHSFDFRPLGLAIREAREKAGLSRNDLGDKVFYGERHIADIENIGKHPSFQLFHDLVTMFNISVDEYFYPAKNVEKNTARRQIDSSLDLLSDNELKIIQGTIDGILNSRENKK